MTAAQEQPATPEEREALVRRRQLERLMRFVAFNQVTGCLTWTGALNNVGYPQIGWGDRTRLAHRVAYELEVGPLLAGHQIDHLCLNKRCVNVEHLEQVTGAENRDRANALQTTCKRGHPLIGRMRGNQRARCCRICEKLDALGYSDDDPALFDLAEQEPADVVDDDEATPSRVHSHAPYRPACVERAAGGVLRGACLNDDGTDRVPSSYADEDLAEVAAAGGSRG